MPKIPEYQARAKPAVMRPAQIPLGFMAGPAFELERAGKQIEQVGQYLLETRRSTEFGQQSVEFTNDLQNLRLELNQDPEVWALSEKAKKAVANFKKDRLAQIKDPILAKHLSLEFDRIGNRIQHTIDFMAQAKQIEYNKATTLATILSDLKGYLTGQVAGGILNQKEAEELYQTEVSVMAFGAVLQDIRDNPYEALESLENNEYPDIDEKQRTQLITKARVEIRYRETEAKQAEADAKEAEEEEIRSIEDHFLVSMVKNQLTVSEILDSRLPPSGPSSKEHWIDKIERRNKAILKGEGDPFTISDQKIRAETLKSIWEDPPTITRQEIMDRIGEGLSTTDGQHFIKELESRQAKTDKPMKSEVFKRSLKAFDDAFKAEIFENYEDYYKSKNEFERIVMEGKVIPTGEKRGLEAKEIEELTVKMLFPHKESFFDRVYSGFITTIFGEEKPAEEMEEMPLASENKGKTIRNTETGKRYRSDGKKWMELK
jgi:hypothetical protein